MVGRADLVPGHQATQACHAAFQFSVEHPEALRDWYPDNLVLVSVSDEDALEALAESAWQDHGLTLSMVHEPDFGGELTAIAIAPSRDAGRLVANLPLTLREAVMA